MSIRLDVNAPSDAVFVSRPWPERSPERSPLHGRPVLVLARLGTGTLADPSSSADSPGRRLAEELSRQGCSAQFSEGAEALPFLLAQTAWEIAIVDEQCSQSDLERLAAATPAPTILFLTEAGDAQAAERARACQALALLERPLHVDGLLVQLGRALERRQLEVENERLRDDLSGRYALANFVTRDPRMKRLLETLETVADTTANVLLTGESGTGKTRLARAIHEHSSRAKAPFIVVSCGALPPNLLESELFGHARGAFTGAVRDKPGKFELADGGTIFLDEINSAPMDLQVKLLRVIQERRLERVGEERTREVDVRIVAATNQPLQQEIEAGRFREDLYWRLHVIALELPPLRERPADVAELAEHFLSGFADRYGKELDGLEPDCLARLVGHSWPGNVRQLENTIERAVLLSSGPRLRSVDLGEDFGPRPGLEMGSPSLLDGLQNLSELPPLKKALEGPERAIIQRALELCGGSRKKTSQMLGVNRTTLFNKMRKYGLMGGPGEPAEVPDSERTPVSGEPPTSGSGQDRGET